MYAVNMQNIVKKFGNFVANDNITLQVRQGEIFAIIGENGAGKSTLMNVLFSLYPCDAGTINIFGKTARFSSPRGAIEAGLGMVHQHFKLVPSLTVTQNIFLGGELSRYGFISYQSQVKVVQKMSKEFGLAIDPEAKIQNLPVGLQQRVEILKVLIRGVKVLILDEPTSVLTPQEANDLFSSLRVLNQEKGLTIIFISHHIQEIIDFSHRLMVLRNGKNVAVKETADTTVDEIAELIIGKKYKRVENSAPSQPGEIVFEAHNVYYRDSFKIPRLKNISINVRKGEIVGVAGVAGNGQEELIKLIAGINHPSYGRLVLNGMDISQANTEKVRSYGLSHVPGDRMHAAINSNESIYFNMMLGKENKPRYRGKIFLRHAVFRKDADGWIETYNVKCQSGKSFITSLSGGNIQKAVIAREFTHGNSFYLIDQPTQGIDIGSSNFIYEELIKRRNNGAAILLFSVQLDEILSLCDRVYVMFNGRIMGELNPKTVTEQKIGLLMTGIQDRGTE